MGFVEGWDPIKMGIDPDIAQFGGLLLTWYGVFTAIGIALGVWAAVKMAEVATMRSPPPVQQPAPR